MKKGFTLAEVLITLGIIGVVAALTMPSLIASYQKKVWVAQLKKDVSILQNAIKSLIADEGVDSLAYTSFYQDAGVDQFGNSQTKLNTDKLKLQYVQKKEQHYWSDKVQNPLIYLADGSCIAIFGDGNWLMQGNPDHISLYIDVNCERKPNLSDKDQFSFSVDNYGKLVLETLDLNASQEEVDAINSLCEQYPELCGSNTSFTIESLTKAKREQLEQLCRDTKDYPQPSCFSLIVHDGWEMNY